MSVIPFIDLKKRYERHKEVIDAAITRVLQSGRYAGGEEVTAFEREFAHYLSVANCIGIGNATDGFELLYRALGVGPGDEVVVPACGLISPAEMATYCGATPVFADVDPTTYNLDPKKLVNAITPKTRAVVCVHLYGQVADIEEIRSICDKQGILLIEDCAQAHGTMVNGKMAGTFGHAGVYSFYPTKNLAALGDAGAIVTNDPELSRKVRQLANHGQSKKNLHLEEGRNSRLDTLQAAILRARLTFLDEENARRISHAAIYDKYLKDLPVQRPTLRLNCEHVFHLYVIRCDNRDELQQWLAIRGVETAVHYPIPVPWQPAYAHLSHYSKSLTGATTSVDSLLSLPIGPELEDAQIEKVGGLISSFYSR